MELGEHIRRGRARGGSTAGVIVKPFFYCVCKSHLRIISTRNNYCTVYHSKTKRRPYVVCKSGLAIRCNNLVEILQERRRCEKGEVKVSCAMTFSHTTAAYVPKLGGDRPWSLIFCGLGIQRPIWQLRVRRRGVAGGNATCGTGIPHEAGEIVGCSEASAAFHCLC